MRLTEKAHEQVAGVLGEGELALDATAGNGHDSLWLARSVGATGHVWAMDVQPEAVASTRKRLQEAGLEERVSLLEASHADMEQFLPARAREALAAVMFNLGYLPGSDRRIVTHSQTTLPALDAALRSLKPGGILSLMVYRGHEGGQQEWEAIRSWLASCPMRHELFGDDGGVRTSPVLVCVFKSGIES